MSRLEERTSAGEFVITAELPSVDSGGIAAVHERFAPYEDYVDAINATDNTAAHAHASAISIAIALKQLGMEPVMQLTCRDRNRIGLQADIAGAALHGIENLLCLTGDPVTAGDEPDATGVFDLDALELLRTAKTLADGHYRSGRTLEPAPRLFLGGAESPGFLPPEARIERAFQKIEAGARFFQLQVTFEREHVENFFEAAVSSGLASTAPLIPSVTLVRSPKALRYMDENVPGITVPAELIERCERADDPEEACFQLAVETAGHMASLPGVAGLHLISFRPEPGIARLCQELGIPTRAVREASGYRHPVPV